jgi:hypothetical protein
MKQLTISIFKIGFSIYGREFWKYNEFYFPGLSISYLDIISRIQIDLELKIFCFGFGVKFFKLK